MENNKLTTLKNGANKIKDKLAKLLPPAVMAAAILNCSAAFAKPNSTKAINNPTPILSTKTVNNYKADTTAFHNLCSSKLITMKDYSRLEADVHNELVNLLTEMNNATLKLAHCYKTLEDHSIATSNLSTNEISAIAKARGKNTQDNVNMSVAKASLQHFMHVALQTVAGARCRAEFMQLMVLDENDSYNEYVKLKFNTKGERDIRKETNIVLTAAKQDLLGYVDYYAKVNGQKSTAASIERNLNQIYALLAHLDQVANNEPAILKLVNETATLLPTSLFGTLEMRRGLIWEYATNYLNIKTLDHLDAIHYDIYNIKAGDSIKKSETKFNSMAAIFGISNTDASLTIGADAQTKWSNNFDLTYGLEAQGKLGFDQDKNPNSIQAMGKVQPGYTFNDKFHLGFPVKAGVEFDKDGVSVPVAAGALAEIKFNEHYGIEFGIEQEFNINRATGRTGAIFMFVWTPNKTKYKFGVDIGYGYSLQNEHAVNEQPDNTKPDDQKPDDQKPDDQKPDDQKPEDPNKKPDEPKLIPGETLGSTSDIHLIPHEPSK